jgi:hypothetical protein
MMDYLFGIVTLLWLAGPSVSRNCPSGHGLQRLLRWQRLRGIGPVGVLPPVKFYLRRKFRQEEGMGIALIIQRGQDRIASKANP